MPMPTLYNTETRKPEAVDDIESAIMNGTHSYGMNDRVNVISPDGETQSVAATELRDAIGQGYRVERPDERAVRQYVDDNKGLGGAAKVALGQFADEALLGLPEMVYEKTGDPLEVAKWEALKKEHDLANTLGGVGGFAASMYAPGVNTLFKGATTAGEAVASHLAEKVLAKSAGEVGKRTAKEIARGILKSAAQYGTEGAVLAAPQAITEEMLGDPQEAGETLLAGVGLGAVFGAGGEFAGELKKRASDLVKAQYLKGATFSDKFRNEAAEKAAEALNPILSQQERLLEPKGMKEVGRTLIDEGIVTPFASAQDMYDRLAQRSQEVGQEIGKSLDVFTQLGDVLSTYDSAIGRKPLDPLIDPAQVADELEHKVLEKYGNKRAYRKSLAQFADEVQALRDSGEKWTVAEANAQKAAYGDLINNWGLDQPIHKKFLQSVYDGINDAVEKKIDEISNHPLFGHGDIGTIEQMASQAPNGAEIVPQIKGLLENLGQSIGSDGANLLADFKDLKRKYGHLETAEVIAKKSAARESRNNDFSLTSFMMGGAGLVAGSQMTDNPYLAGLAGVAGLFGRRWLREYGNQLWSHGLEKAGILLSEQTMKRAAERLDGIEGVLRKMGEKSPAVNTTTGILGGAVHSSLYKDLFGEPVKSDSTSGAKAERYAKLQDKMMQLQGNPQAAMSQIANVTWPISAGGAPNIGAEFNRKLNDAYQYLMGAMPKPTRPPNPFIAERKYIPTDAELSAFEQKAQVVVDPFSVLDELKAGTLTKNHVEALRTIYPRLYQRIQGKIFEAATNAQTPLSYGQRLKLSLLMGSALDQSLSAQAIQGYQTLFQGQPTENGQTMPGGGGKPIPGAGKMQIANDYQTKMDRIRAGH